MKALKNLGNLEKCTVICIVIYSSFHDQRERLMLISGLSHPANDIVNGIVNVVVTMKYGYLFDEKLANALDLRSEALAG